MANQVVVDLETQDSAGTAVIIAFGAVVFDPDTGIIGEKFSVNVDPQTCLAVGMTTSEDTLKWWSAQSSAAQAAWKVNPISIQDCLKQFTEFMVRNKVKVVYGNGATFDNVIVRNAYAACKMNAPWRYTGDFCFRTLKGLFKVPEPVRAGTHHNALDDAVHEANWLIAILKQYRPVTSTNPTA